MRYLTAFASAFSLAFTVVACGSAQDADATQSAAVDQDMTAAKSELVGSWTITDASKDLTSSVAYELRPNGQFWRDDNRILNGVLVNGAPRPVQRTTGHYTVDADKNTITFRVESPAEQKGVVEVLSYTFEAGKILNGVFLPGHEPDTRAHLTLQGIPAKGSHVAFPAIVYQRDPSYCTSTQDCQDEAKDKTWLEGAGAPAVSCDETNRVCIAAVN